MTKELCKNCNSENVVLVEYNMLDTFHYDGTSEIKCMDCNARFGRWTGKELKDGEQERPYGGVSQWRYGVKYQYNKIDEVPYPRTDEPTR